MRALAVLLLCSSLASGELIAPLGDSVRSSLQVSAMLSQEEPVKLSALAGVESAASLWEVEAVPAHSTIEAWIMLAQRLGFTAWQWIAGNNPFSAIPISLWQASAQGENSDTILWEAGAQAEISDALTWGVSDQANTALSISLWQASAQGAILDALLWQASAQGGILNTLLWEASAQGGSSNSLLWQATTEEILSAMAVWGVSNQAVPYAPSAFTLISLQVDGQLFRLSPIGLAALNGMPIQKLEILVQKANARAAAFNEPENDTEEH